MQQALLEPGCCCPCTRSNTSADAITWPSHNSIVEPTSSQNAEACPWEQSISISNIDTFQPIPRSAAAAHGLQVVKQQTLL